jgi:hypothetical protein
MGMRLGMIGLGKMGLPLARQMMADGHEVCGYDIDPERMKMLREAGGHPVASAKEMAGHSEITFSILLAPEHIEENTIGPKGIATPAGRRTTPPGSSKSTRVKTASRPFSPSLRWYPCLPAEAGKPGGVHPVEGGEGALIFGDLTVLVCPRPFLPA